MLLDNGVVYDHAYYPHAMPGTAPGHATLNTGTHPRYHGIVSNYWYDEQERRVPSDRDTRPQSTVFGPNGMCSYGRSSHTIMVDGLSDQFVLHTQPLSSKKAFALSFKSRAAIGCATKAGKAIWFDNEAGRFTSSGAYFDTLPDWLTKFNTTHDLSKHGPMTWQPVYPQDHAAYNFYHHGHYEYAKAPQLIGREIQITPAVHSQEELEQIKQDSYDGTAHKNHAYKEFLRMPQASQLLLDLAKECIKNYRPARKSDQLLLYISLSGLDKVGHAYGPYSLEAIDTLYHTDRQLKDFIKFVYDVADKDDVLFVLTGDHGVMPTPEVLKYHTDHRAHRIDADELRQKLNEEAQQKFGVKELVAHYQTPGFFLNKKLFASMPEEQQLELLETLKEFLKEQKGIKNVWTYREMSEMEASKGTIEYLFREQFYEGRSGHLICQVHPYYMLTNHSHGTCHGSPYDYDTHVPLVLYQKDRLAKKQITKKVWLSQVAPTLAYLLKVPRPSASTQELLPGIVDQQHARHQRSRKNSSNK